MKEVSYRMLDKGNEPCLLCGNEELQIVYPLIGFGHPMVRCIKCGAILRIAEYKIVSEKNVM